MTVWENGFSRKEFACKCGCNTVTAIDAELLEVLVDVREYFGKRTTIVTSGCRCSKHNRNVGGAKASKHVLGMAADFYIKGVDVNDIYNYLVNKYSSKYGIAFKKNQFVHVDTWSDYPRRWEY